MSLTAKTAKGKVNLKRKVANTLMGNILLQNKMAISTLWHTFMEGLEQKIVFFAFLRLIFIFQNAILKVSLKALIASGINSHSLCVFLHMLKAVLQTSHDGRGEHPRAK